jgi:twitching motility protein PilI
MAKSKEKNVALELLRELERRATSNAAGLPQQEEVKNEWIGIGFRIGDFSFVAPLGEVAELLRYPELSRVPGTKQWVRGIANVRGNLLPVMDLKGYLLQEASTLTGNSRVLVVNHEGVYSGLLVDEVLGLKHFLDEERRKSIPEVNDFIKTYLSGSFIVDGQQWGIFSMHALAESHLFVQVAV